MPRSRAGRLESRPRGGGEGGRRRRRPGPSPAELERVSATASPPWMPRVDPSPFAEPLKLLPTRHGVEKGVRMRGWDEGG
jgi:hypothetical protein